MCGEDDMCMGCMEVHGQIQQDRGMHALNPVHQSLPMYASLSNHAGQHMLGAWRSYGWLR